jgi:hypothetical protein
MRKRVRWTVITLSLLPAAQPMHRVVQDGATSKHYGLDELLRWNRKTIRAVIKLLGRDDLPQRFLGCLARVPIFL